MKKLLSFFVIFAALCVCADAFDMTGKWVRLTWKNYEPYPTVKTVDSVLHVSGVTSKYGFKVKSSKYFNAESGDRLVFNATVRGRGRIRFKIQCFADNGRRWTGIAPESDRAELSSEWNNVQLSVPVVDLPKGMTSKVMATLHIGRDEELFMKDSSITVEKGDVSGDLPFPRLFKVFVIGRNGENIDFPKDRIPDEVLGVKPVNITMNNNFIDFSGYFGKRVLRENALLYTKIKSPSDVKYTIGAGADYFMACYLNGEKVIDTMKSGDGADKPHFTNHRADVKLKKGDNIFVVHFQTGRGPRPSVSLGGPLDMRNLSSVLTISEIFESDDYETEVERSGNPRIVQDILTDGMEQRSGQAVYPSGSVFGSEKMRSLPSKAGEKYLAISLRVSRFPEMGSIELILGEDLRLCIKRSHEHPEDVELAVMYKGNRNKSIRIPVKSLPNDFMLAASPSEYFVNASSLNDSKLRFFSGRLNLEDRLAVRPSVAINTGNATVDEFKLGLAEREVRNSNIPMKLEHAPEFDPVKAGWKLVWSDEFDGGEVDWENTWMNSPWAPDSENARNSRKYAVLKDGKLHIRCEWFGQRKDGTYIGHTTGLYSRRHFGYGYYEARVRFTKKKGWWAAFWMHNEGRNCQLGGGYEIDIFEDYSTRSGEPVIASNLHVTRGPNINNYGSHFRLPGTLDDFYIVGVKWTPFEVSTYINGKLVEARSRHTPLTTLTYDAVNHALGTSKLYVCLSGQAGRSGGSATEPGMEEYIVDYVRAYEYPSDDAPEVKWVSMPPACVKTGEKISFEVEASEDAETAYLFDNGFLVDYKTSKPFVFDLAIDKTHYADTRWNRAGRSGRAPVMDGYPHVFRVCVQNAKGKVGMTEAMPVIADIQPGTPEKVFEIPGIVTACMFNRGGHNVCSYKQEKAANRTQGAEVHSRKNLHLREAGEYVSYTVDVKKAGRYSVRMKRRSFRREWDTRAMLIAGGRYAGELLGGKNAEYAVGEVDLKAGRQNIILVSAGTFGLQPEELIFELK